MSFLLLFVYIFNICFEMELSDDLKAKFFNFKSKYVYEKWINEFKEWILVNGKKEDINGVLEYIMYLSETYAVSTLWHVYAILNKYMKVFKSVNLNECIILKDYLKELERTHNPKKSAVFSRHDIDNFLLLDDNDDTILLKAILIIGVYGLLRKTELTELQFCDIKKTETHYVINIKQSKTDQAQKGFKFFIEGDDMSYITKYMDCFSADKKSGRFFRKMSNKKGTNRGLGKNTIGLSLINNNAQA